MHKPETSRPEGVEPTGERPHKDAAHDDPDMIHLLDVDPEELAEIGHRGRHLPDTVLDAESLRKLYGVSSRALHKLMKVADVKLVPHPGGGSEHGIRARQILRLTHVLDAYHKLHDHKRKGQQ